MYHLQYHRPNEPASGWKEVGSFRTMDELVPLAIALIAQGYEIRIVHL